MAHSFIVIQGCGPCNQFGSFSVIVVFILSALWWVRIRGLLKLPDGSDWLWGNLGLVLMGGAILSKSLIQFSVDGWHCVPSCYLAWGPAMVAVIAAMTSSFPRAFASTCIQYPWPRGRPLSTETPGHSQSSLALALTGPLLLSPGSWCTQVSVCALWASLAGMGFDSKHDFAPPTILLGPLLCSWT